LRDQNQVIAPAATSLNADAAPGMENAFPPGSPAAGTIARAPSPPSRVGVLRHTHFRNVWFGAMVSNVGGWMEGVGVQWIVAHTTGSALMMGYLAAAQLGPTLVLGMVGGLTADRFNRKKLLLGTQAIMMFIAAMLMLTSYFGRATPAVLLVLSLLQGVTLAFNTPAWQVLTPRLVPREELTEAIALNGLQFNLARVVGPALAGILMATYGPTVLFLVNTVSFLGVLIAIASTPDAPAPPHTGASAWRRTTEALSFVFRGRGPRAVFIGMVVFATFAAPLMRMLPLFAKSVYTPDDPIYRFIQRRVANPESAREFIFGLLLAMIGVGAVAGAMAIRRIPRWYPKHHFIPLSVALSGISIAAFSATTSLSLAMVILIASGVFWLWSFNSAFAAMQLLVADSMRGRVMSVVNVAVFGAMPLGVLIAGLIARFVSGRADDAFGIQVSVGAMGAILAAAGMVMLIWRTPEVDGLAPGDPGYARTPGLLRGLTAKAHKPVD